MYTKNVINILRPRLITFDVTGTLLKTKLEEHYLEVSLQHGLTVTKPQLLAPSFKNHFKKLSHKHPVFGKHTGIGWENWWKNIVYNVFKDQDPSISEETLEKIATTLIDDYGTNKCWFKFPGAIEILQYLNDQKIIVGVISNFDERLQQLLISTEIRKYLNFVLTSYDHGHEKPHISIFQKALNIAKKKYDNEINPKQALHIGDNLELDYHGAKNAGWNAIIMEHEYQTHDKYKNISNDEIFKNLGELKNYFENNFN